jgi:hypothetical protein
VLQGVFHFEFILSPLKREGKRVDGRVKIRGNIGREE